MLRYLLAGESHGPALVGILEGFPAGLRLPPKRIDADLARRLAGHGRGFRARNIERDAVEFLAGLWRGKTLGSPIALVIANRDHTARQGRPQQSWSVPRPGHADLPGLVRYGFDDCAPVAERASGRTTAALTAAGACAKELLRVFGITVLSHVVRIGDQQSDEREPTLARLRRVRTSQDVRCLDAVAARRMVAAIDEAQRSGTTLGGLFEVVAFGLPVGLGTYVHPDRRLDAALAQDVMAIPSVKGVEIGDAAAVSRRPGSEAQDEILPAADAASAGAAHTTGAAPTAPTSAAAGVRRSTNRAGGLEGGITNGEPLRVRGIVKPLATQRERLRSVDLQTGRAARAAYVRSDICVVPAAGVVGEAVVAWRLADVLTSMLGGDNLEVMRARFADTFPAR